MTARSEGVRLRPLASWDLWGVNWWIILKYTLKNRMGVRGQALTGSGFRFEHGDVPSVSITLG